MRDVGQFEHRLASFEQQDAGIRQADGMTGPVQQPDAESALKRRDVFADGALRERKMFGRAGEASGRCDLAEGAQEVQTVQDFLLRRQAKPRLKKEPSPSFFLRLASTGDDPFAAPRPHVSEHGLDGTQDAQGIGVEERLGLRGRGFLDRADQGRSRAVDSTSMRVVRSMMDWIPRSTETASRISISTNSTPGNAGAFARLRTVPNTRHPRSANFWAATRPMPDDTPVTTTTDELYMAFLRSR